MPAETRIVQGHIEDVEAAMLWHEAAAGPEAHETRWGQRVPPLPRSLVPSCDCF
jgi:hypothetical protein